MLGGTDFFNDYFLCFCLYYYYFFHFIAIYVMRQGRDTQEKASSCTQTCPSAPGKEKKPNNSLNSLSSSFITDQTFMDYLDDFLIIYVVKIVCCKGCKAQCTGSAALLPWSFQAARETERLVDCAPVVHWPVVERCQSLSFEIRGLGKNPEKVVRQ